MYVTGRGIRIAIVVAVGLAGASAALAQRPYAATDLGSFGGRVDEDVPTGLNDLGEVVGYSGSLSENQIHAFYWRAGQMTDLHPFGNWSYAWGINRHGEIVGVTSATAGVTTLIRWDRQGYVDLGLGVGRAINAAGLIAGDLMTQSGGFLYDAGQFINLDPIFRSRAISADGHVVGTANIVIGGPCGPTTLRGAVWDGQSVIDLGTLGGCESEARDINDQNDIVGWASDADGRVHGVMWRDGEIAETFSLGGSASHAYAINNRGQVAGLGLTDRGFWHMFLAQDSEIIDLWPFLPPEVADRVHRISGINEVGQILVTLDSDAIAVVLTPHPCNDLIIGDANCDGEINAFDIEPFIAALFEPQTYADNYGCNWLCMNDVNGDGAVDAFDIEPFLGLLFP